MINRHDETANRSRLRSLCTGITLAAVLVLHGLAPRARSSDAPVRPNVVLIMADDMGQGDLGCYNAESKIPTPHMDRLAAEGMRFTDAHSPSSVCTPTRYGLLTGRYCWRTRLKSGVLWGYSRRLIEPGRTTIASLLKEQGYRTGVVGKWHLGLQEFDPQNPDAEVDYTKPLTDGPNDVGFDFAYVIPASLDMDPYVWIENEKLVEAPTERTPGSKRVWSGGDGFWRAGPIAPSFEFHEVLPTIGRKAVEFVEAAKSDEDRKPFFLYVPLASPHTPWVPSKEFVGKTEVGPYGDFTHQCDAVVGDVLQALERNDLAENTLVIVTSDNGSHWPAMQIEKYGHDANNGRRGMKADAWEGGHRVPFLVRWPGRIEAGTVTDQTICLTDVMPTCAAIVGAELPKDAAEDGFDLSPVLFEQSEEPIRPATVHHSVNGTFAIRVGNWKLIEGLGSGGFTSPRTVKPMTGGPQGQLYDLAADPTESNNLWLERPETVAELQAVLDEIRDRGRSRR